MRALSFEYALTPRGVERGCRITFGDDGLIASVEAGVAGPWDGSLALPGMPNAHSHAFQRALVGSGESPAAGSFWSWRDSMYRLANAIDADDLYVIALRAFADMLRAGFTSVGEFHYIHHARDGRASTEMSLALREAARDAGIRIVLLPVLYQRGGFDRAALEEQRRFLHASLDDFGKLLEALRGEPCGVAPHSLRAVPLSQLPALVAMADSILGPDCPIHIHVSEQRREVEECHAFHGHPPIECLSDTVDLGPRWSLVHATHAQAHEVTIIEEAEPNLVLCPLTEAYLGDGLFPLGKASGLRFAIGSDSNARIDAIEELRLAEYGQRLKLEKRSLLANEHGLGAAVWSSAAQVGGRSLAQPVGRLETGYQADIVVLDLENGLFAGVRPEKLLDAWIVGGSAVQIADVYVGGRKRVAQGSLLSQVPADRFANVMKRVFSE